MGDIVIAAAILAASLVASSGMGETYRSAAKLVAICGHKAMERYAWCNG
jgi:hypothetical protein